MNADKTFHHLALDYPMTLQTRRDIFGDMDILTNMEWTVDELLDFSYSDQINPLPDPHDVHDFFLTYLDGYEGSSSMDQDV